MAMFIGRKGLSNKYLKTLEFENMYKRKYLF